MLLENSIYTNEEEKELFLKDKVLIADAFYINVIGFLSLYSISHKRGLIKTYMSNKNVALAHIADESNDLLVSLKAYNHIGGITMDTTHKLTRLLALIAEQLISSKGIDEIEIRELVGECKLETHRPNPLIYAITKKFIEGDSLIHLAKEYYRVIKSNKKIKGVSKELVKIMSQYTTYFKKQDAVVVSDTEAMDSQHVNDLDDKVHTSHDETDYIPLVYMDPTTPVTLDPKELLQSALKGEINLYHYGNAIIDLIADYLEHSYNMDKDRDLFINAVFPHQSLASLNIPDKIVDYMAYAFTTNNLHIWRLSQYMCMGVAVIQHDSYPEVEKKLKLLLVDRDLYPLMRADLTKVIQDLYTIDEVVYYIMKFNTLNDDDFKEDVDMLSHWVEKYGNELILRLNGKIPTKHIFALISSTTIDVDYTIFNTPEYKTAILKSVRTNYTILPQHIKKAMANVSRAIFKPKQIAGFILSEPSIFHIFEFIFHYSKGNESRLMDAVIETIAESDFDDDVVVKALSDLIECSFDVESAVFKGSEPVQLKIYRALLKPNRVINDLNNRGKNAELYMMFNGLKEHAQTVIIYMMSNYLKSSHVDNNGKFDNDSDLNYVLDYFQTIVGQDMYRLLRDATFLSVDAAALVLSDKDQASLFLKMASDKDISDKLNTYNSYAEYNITLGQAVTGLAVNNISTKSAVSLLGAIDRLYDGGTESWSNDCTLLSTRVISDYLTTDAVDQSVLSQLYNSANEYSSKTIADKLAQSHVLFEINNQIMSDENPIKPYGELHKDRLLEVLSHNNVDLTSHGIETRFGASFYVLEDYIKNKAKQIKMLDDVKATQVVMNDFDLDTMSLEYDKFNNRAHGNIAVKFLRSFNVDIPLMNKEYDKFLAMFDGKLDADHANYIYPMFHGTGSVAASMILRYGFAVISEGDPSTAGRMLGDGIYLTNVIDKCSQYIGDRGCDGWDENVKNTGFILECEVQLGAQGYDKFHVTDGTDEEKRLNIVSPEWVVFYPNMQIKIKKAHEVEVVYTEYMDNLKKKRGIMESNIKPFKQFLFEGKTGNKEALTYIFRDGNIPVSEDKYVKFEDFDPKAFGDNIKLDYTGSGPAVIIYNDKKTHTRIVPMITHFMRDQRLMDEYLSYLTGK